MAYEFPRIMLALMLSIVLGLGFAARNSHPQVAFAPGFAGTTFDLQVR